MTVGLQERSYTTSSDGAPLGWAVSSLCLTNGLVQARSIGGRVLVEVCDAGAHDSCCTRAWLGADGEVEIRCQTAPPALMVSGVGSGLLPSAPGDSGRRRLEPGDVLVMCSAAALDRLPAGIGAVMAWNPRVLALTAPDVLLERLLEDSDQGVALVVRYQPGTDGAAP